MSVLLIALIHGVLISFSAFPLTVFYSVRSFAALELCRYVVLFLICIQYYLRAARYVQDITKTKKVLATLFILTSLTLLYLGFSTLIKFHIS